MVAFQPITRLSAKTTRFLKFGRTVTVTCKAPPFTQQQVNCGPLNTDQKVVMKSTFLMLERITVGQLQPTAWIMMAVSSVTKPTLKAPYNRTTTGFLPLQHPT